MIDYDESFINIGGKVCKYCGTYYAPEGTWRQINGHYVCPDCYEEKMIDFYAEMEDPRKKKCKLFAPLAQLVRVLA